MSTLPTSPRAGSGARWLVPIGVLIMTAGVLLLINTGNEDLVNWFQDNSSCNERPCTYDEAQGILVGIGTIATLIGALMWMFGLWRHLRSRDAGPALPPAAPAPAPARKEGAEAAPGAGFEARYGFADKPTGNSPADRLAALDAQLAGGELSLEDYLKRRESILDQM